MIAWVKNLIKKENFGYLTTTDNQKTRTEPIVYVFEKGHLICTSSILFHEKLDNIKQNSDIQLLISDDFSNPNAQLISIQAKSILDETDLDNKWKLYSDNLFEVLPKLQKYYEEEYKLPQFWKRSIIDIVPNKIFAFKEGINSEPEEYNMEIL